LNMPDWKEEITRRLASLKLAPAREAEIVEEVAQHLDDRYQELVAGGAIEEEACRMALEELSDEDLLARGLRRVEQEVMQVPLVPDGEGRGNFLVSIGQDVRYCLRTLRKNPGFTAMAVITLALRIGANTAIFSLINAIMLRFLPIRDPQRLVVLKWTARRPPKTHVFYGWSGCPIGPSDLKGPAAAGCSFSYPMFEQVRTENKIFTAAFAFVPASLTVNIDGNASFASGELVSGEFFPTLGVRPAFGRVLGPADDRGDAPPAVVLSYGYWKRQFGGAASVIGRSIVVNGVPYTVVGVGPPGFLGLDPGIV
jgi:hypothetical protein